MGAEALVDWLRGQGFAKADIDLLLDPAKKLTDDFLADIERVAPKRRLVLMLDTFEQFSALEDWARDLAQRLHPNVLLVIVGRAMPNWGRARPGWLAQAHVEELKPMTDDVMRDLVRRYYATIRGGEPDPKQVDAIIALPGLPMVVTTAVQLWVEHGVEDFATVKAEVVADLVDRLKEGVPAEMMPVLEARRRCAGSTRTFCAMTGQTDVNQAYDELRRFPFVRSRVEGLALHDAVREIMDECLRVHDPERHRELHERAAGYFEVQMAGGAREEVERLGLERLYHRIRQMRKLASSYSRRWRKSWCGIDSLNRLRVLLNDANTYLLERENSRLWREYYGGRLVHLETRLLEAEKVYSRISENDFADWKLRAYALNDLGWVLKRREYLRRPGMEARAISVLKRSLDADVPIDSKLAMGWIFLSDIYTAKAEWDEAVSYAHVAGTFFREHGDAVSLVYVLEHERGIFGRQGNWVGMIRVQSQIREAMEKLSNPVYLKARMIEAWDWLWIGRYREYETALANALEVAKSLEDQEWLTAKTRDLGLCLGLQGKCKEASSTASQALEMAYSWGKIGELEVFIALSFLGIVCYICGEFRQAEDHLLKAIDIGQRLHAHLDYAPLYAGILYETTQRLDEAESHFHLARAEAHRIDRHYYESSSLAGLVRVKHVQGDYGAVPPLLAQAEQLAQQYEYNDHLASLRLTQGHVAWDGHIPDWGSGFDAALHFYQHALIYALRYNRFLLDEALSGRPQGTPLRPIIAHCLVRGEEGQRMLMALRDWWQTGVNDISTPRPDTISPIPEDIPLLEAERIAREREPGDGSPQKTVTEQIDAALSR